MKSATSVASKLLKTEVLLKNKQLQPFIPATKKMNRNTLEQMLNQYGMVYVKPCCGALGKGVMRVEKQVAPEKTSYQYHRGVRVHRFARFSAMYSALLQETKGRPYLVQKGILLLTHRGRPFDIRVMVQRNLLGQWEASGLAARVAHPRKIVTNGSQGGTIYPVELLLKQYTQEQQTSELIQTMMNIGVNAANALSAEFPGLREFGVDLAVDLQLKIWILEVNTKPDPCPFTKLPDKTMINRILRYAKAAGITYKLKCTKSQQGIGL